MLITASINIFGKVHKRPLEDRQSFSNVSYAILVAKCLRHRNVCVTAKDLPWPRVYFRAATGLRTSKPIPGVICFQSYRQEDRQLPARNFGTGIISEFTVTRHAIRGEDRELLSASPGAKIGRSNCLQETIAGTQAKWRLQHLEARDL